MTPDAQDRSDTRMVTAMELFDAWLKKSEPEIGREAWWLTDAYPAVLAALEEVKERKNQVCEGYELCEHVGCAASYAAFAIADKALADALAAMEVPDDE